MHSGLVGLGFRIEERLWLYLGLGLGRVYWLGFSFESSSVGV